MTEADPPPVEVNTDEFSELFRSVSSWGRWGEDDERGALNRLAPERVAEISEQLGLPAIGVSVLDDGSLDRFREELWQLTSLIRIYLRSPGQKDEEAHALPPEATVIDAARLVHHALAETCTGAHITGPSAKFDHQRVGRDHVLADGDTVEIV